MVRGRATGSHENIQVTQINKRIYKLNNTNELTDFDFTYFGSHGAGLSLTTA